MNVSGLGSGLVTLNGGTLSMTNSTGDNNSPNSAWPLNVPTGFAGRLNADGRSTLSGALTGGGDFTFHTPFIRTDLTGNWSAFTGRIFVVTDADGGEFRIKNTAGYAGAQLDLGDRVSAFYNNTSGNLTLQVGALSGAATSYLSGGLSSGGTITWQVGARNEDTTFAGVIGNNTGPSALTKVGTGTLTLSGANTYSGATTISAGRLQVNGSSSATSYTVQSGGTLGGSGTITGNVTVQAGGALEHGISGATPLAIAGNLSFGANAVIRPVAGGSFEAGTYTVLTYSGTLTGTPAFTWEAPSGSSFTATFSTATAGIITMTLVAPARSPGLVTWTGSSSSNWDNSTTNWTIGAQSTPFMTGDAASFTDSGNASAAINLVANVQPTAVIVNSAQNYIFSGSGLIVDGATLSKSGGGTLTLSAAHSFSGGTIISGGTVLISNAAALGTGAVNLAGGTWATASLAPQNPVVITADSTITGGNSGGTHGIKDISGAGILTLSADGSGVFDLEGDLGGFSGTIAFAGTGGFRFFGGTNTGSSAATFDLGTRGLSARSGAAFNLGALVGEATGYLGMAGNSNSAGCVFTIGGKNVDASFAGIIANGSASKLVGIVKTGSGTQTLAGASTYTGTTTVTSGKLSVTGSLAATPVTVATTGTLGGTGSIGGTVTCNGTLAPGITAGTLTLSAGLTLASTSTLAFELGSVSDRVGVTGNLTLDGTVNVTAAAGFTAGTYTLVTYTGSLTNNTLNVGNLPAGYTATVNTSTSGQVRLIVTPTNSAPQISVAASASPSVVTTTTTDLTVTATDDAGEGDLTYTWSATGPAAVGFSSNMTNAAKNASATFSAPGSYTLTVTVTDVPGLSAVSSVSVTVVATTASLTVDPPSATLVVGGTQTLAATPLDQFGNPMLVPVAWSASGGGEITQSGVYTATAAGGPWQATASTGSLDTSAAITVTSRTFEAWEAATFTQLQINAGESAMAADPDKDGLINLAEYALGTLPYSFTPQPSAVPGDSSMSITFQRPAWIGDVIYHAEACDDFSDWSALTLEVLTPGADPETVRATYTLPVPKPEKSFLRLRFEK